MQIITSKNNKLAKVVNNKYVQHISYWAFYLVFFAITWGSYDRDFAKTISVELINLPAKMLFVYWTIYFLFPQFLYKRKIWLFILFFGISLILTAIVQRILDNYIILEHYLIVFNKMPIFDFAQIIRASINLSTVIAIPFIIKLVDYLNNVQKKEQELEKEKLEAELLFLKNQVQPHFLFNTLNSLYALILKKSDQSLDVILKLSNLLRYMLYETNTQSVELSKEIDCIKSYLDLEKIRHGDRIDLSLNIWGDASTNSIAPMIILPFIENSFKHSTKGHDDNIWITIEIGIKEDSLVLKVENNISKLSADQKSMVGGIGMENVKRRLSLIYPQKHELKIQADEDTYGVFLKLKLNE